MVAKVISAEVDDDVEERIREVAGDRSRSAGVRELIRRGFAVEEAEERAREAEERAREAVEEMQNVREERERERRRIVLLAGIALTGLALTFTTPAAGIAVAVAGLVGVLLVAGGVVDWLAGRREGTEGLTEPPGPARDDG
jgi:Flp pilus assembly protein TadB